MIEGRPFLYQGLDGKVYRVDEDGVQPIQYWSSDTGIVAFVDGDKKDHEPKPLLFHHNVQIIMASSPRSINSSWITQSNDGLVTILIAKLWSARELFLAGFVLGLLLSTLG